MRSVTANRGQAVVRIIGKKRGRAAVKDRRDIERPGGDRDLSLALFVAMLAAIVLVAMQIGSSSFDRAAVATMQTVDAAGQPRPMNIADAFGQRVR